MLKANKLIVVALIIIIGVGSSDAADGKDKKWKAKIKAHQLTAEITQEIIYRANHYGLEPLLVMEVMRQESSFNPQACSSANAKGLMQFIPSTARRFGITDPHNVAQSVDAGCRYLAFLIRKFNGRLDLVLAGYNAGEGAVERYGNRVPPFTETENYVRVIISNYRRALAVKQAFLLENNLAQNKIVVAQANESKSKSSRYKSVSIVSKKPLTKKQLQQKLEALDDFAFNGNSKTIALKSKRK